MGKGNVEDYGDGILSHLSDDDMIVTSVSEVLDAASVAIQDTNTATSTIVGRIVDNLPRAALALTTDIAERAQRQAVAQDATSFDYWLQARKYKGPIVEILSDLAKRNSTYLDFLSDVEDLDPLLISTTGGDVGAVIDLFEKLWRRYTMEIIRGVGDGRSTIEVEYGVELRWPDGVRERFVDCQSGAYGTRLRAEDISALQPERRYVQRRTVTYGPWVDVLP